MHSEVSKTNTPGPLYIGISGKKQVGKDTSAEIITSILTRQGITVQTTAFAAALKDMCISILGLSPRDVYGTDDEKNQPSHILWDTLPEQIRYKYAIATEPIREGGTSNMIDMPVMRTGPMTNREVLQIVGTDIFRAMLCGSVWFDVPFKRKWPSDVVIITDVRFENEKEIIEQHGGKVLRLSRETGLDADGHASEIALDNVQFDFTYQNDKTIPDLAEYLDSFLEKINGSTTASD